MIDKATELAHLLSLSQSMLEQAKSSCWDEVIELEAERCQLMAEFFLTPGPDAIAGAVAQAIQSIMTTDQEITELARAGKLELELVLRQFDQGRKAIKAYNS